MVTIMLGCQDFCGYYDWTFHYMRRRWGNDSLQRLLREAIGGESQRHYAEAGARAGLRGLYDTWTKTGEDEHCDWTFTLDERKNVLRCDMRQCPSKGFLNENDLNADEDYCNHCTGWMIPLLEGIGSELLEHEHNHCGQCWFTIRMKDRPSGKLHVEGDIRNDPRWGCGYLDRWKNDRPLPLLPSVCASPDSCDVLESWFARHPTLTILDTDQGKSGQLSTPSDKQPEEMAVTAAVLTTGTLYADRQRCPVNPSAVLIEHDASVLQGGAARFLATAIADRPLLIHPFLPGLPPLDFVACGLPRPVPILPLLIRAGLYVHRPGGPQPEPRQWLTLLVKALRKEYLHRCSSPGERGP
ncbi:MAG: hypothetical protein RBS80_29120 [Thermoguttaceae bacterium]|jgi:hypothetical protein|nr:hypothetical protein [Thermoguttaceae bacterium]